MCGTNPSEFRVCAISVQKQSKTKVGWRVLPGQVKHTQDKEGLGRLWDGVCPSQLFGYGPES